MKENTGFSDWFFSLLSSDGFSTQFYATVGASIVLLLLQFVARWVAEKRKKLYAITYILDTSFRLEYSAFILLRHTIVPHIEATKRIIDGDIDLLTKMFVSDEFDILKAGPISFGVLPEEYKVLLGCDDIELVQAFETLLFLASSDTNRSDLNGFVKENLKSFHDFLSLDGGKQKDILNTYWDGLRSLQHEETRLIAFVNQMLVRRMRSYLEEWQFFLFSTTAAKKVLAKLESVEEKNQDLIPDDGHFMRSKMGGIQGAL